MSWMRTRDASEQLGVSSDTLKRRREVSGGFLENGEHYCLGPSKNSTITWHVDRCRDAFNQRGLQARKGVDRAKKRASLCQQQDPGSRSSQFIGTGTCRPTRGGGR